MKLKYYLRGLGIGIIVTAVIMGVSSGGKQTEMTEAQIIAKAKELGMVDGVLSQFEETESLEQAEKETEGVEAPENTEMSESADAPENTELSESADASENTELSESAEASENMELSEATEAAADSKQSESTETPEAETEAVEEPEQEVVKKIIVTVYPGEGSYTVSRKLAALGLVESADIYDKFLCQNGYDKKIITGNHEIEAGMTAEEIAKALTIR